MADDGLPVPGGRLPSRGRDHPGGATPSPSVSNVDGLTGDGEPTPSVRIGSMGMPLFTIPESGIGSGAAAGTGATRRLATTGSLVTTSVAKDGDQLVDDGQEEGSGGSDVVVRGDQDADQEVRSDDLVHGSQGFSDLDQVVGGVVGSPITSFTLAAAGHLFPFVDVPYAKAFGSPLPRELLVPSAPPSASTGQAGLVPYSSPSSTTSSHHREWDWDWLLRQIAAQCSQISSAASASLCRATPSAVTAGPFVFVPTSAIPYAPTTTFVATDPNKLQICSTDVVLTLFAANRFKYCSYYKTILCPYHFYGHGCSLGDTCTYTHRQEEVRVVMWQISSPYQADIGDASSSGISGPSSSSTIGSVYKTRLCTTFMRGRLCLYSANCAFAHGEMELRGREQAACRFDTTTTILWDTKFGGEDAWATRSGGNEANKGSVFSTGADDWLLSSLLMMTIIAATMVARSTTALVLVAVRLLHQHLSVIASAVESSTSPPLLPLLPLVELGYAAAANPTPPLDLPTKGARSSSPLFGPTRGMLASSVVSSYDEVKQPTLARSTSFPAYSVY
ncbi:hypothetical protein E2562_007377 [Oryza meyeriana var. granulata]|uniref:C3H1-type domain-containing protein n=1 Tax=Oryza meyeriana var. granulata TaxID=110450 RepID=A0A6G1D1G0_9ORYZ|nr:hypothetical protein E2562_007377 [Oryza meyeriana var. granulata]